MDFYRQTIRRVPPLIEVPEELRDRDVEVIILPLENGSSGKKDSTVDSFGYPVGFFEETAGSLANDPIERAPQGDLEVREELN
ncbi:MAG: hypothetical protein IPM50_07490 [Acidobacteriota bacterium]|nr:MAG: hypothetical protein IPM50_07490 [Acidobacteriota bacterium]